MEYHFFSWDTETMLVMFRKLITRKKRRKGGNRERINLPKRHFVF